MTRKQQKERARVQRLAEERARAERARRQRRIRNLAGMAIVAVAAFAVAIALSSAGAGSAPNPLGRAGKQAAASVDHLLAGIPEAGNTLGSPRAKVTLTEFADLKCPYCRELALGPESQLIAREVRSGTVKLVYRSLCTATCAGPQPGVFTTQQAAMLAAGLQHRAWYYLELFYHLQGDETTSYVTPAFLHALAKLVPGLDYTKWQSERFSSGLAAQVAEDQRLARTLGFTGTPSVIVQGPKGTRTIQYLGDYGTYESAIRAVE